MTRIGQTATEVRLAGLRGWVDLAGKVAEIQFKVNPRLYRGAHRGLTPAFAGGRLYATVATNIFPSPFQGEGEGGGAAFGIGTSRECAPPSRPSPFKGEGEKSPPPSGGSRCYPRLRGAHPINHGRGSVNSASRVCRHRPVCLIGR